MILDPVKHQKRDDERGMLLYCSQCNELAKYWRNGIPFCTTHWIPTYPGDFIHGQEAQETSPEDRSPAPTAA